MTHNNEQHICLIWVCDCCFFVEAGGECGDHPHGMDDYPDPLALVSDGTCRRSLGMLYRHHDCGKQFTDEPRFVVEESSEIAGARDCVGTLITYIVWDHLAGDYVAYVEDQTTAETIARLLSVEHPAAMESLDCECEQRTFMASSCDGCGVPYHGVRHAMTLWYGTSVSSVE